MSIPIHVDDNSCFNSAISLPLTPCLRFSSHSTSANSTSTSASSAIPHSAPWSQINTRLVRDNSPFQWQPQWLTPAPTFDGLDSQPYRSQDFVQNLDSIVARLGLSVPESSQPTLFSSPPSPPLPLLWAAASSAPTSSSLATSNPVQRVSSASSGILYCGQCDTGFTGAYRRGNLKRHVNQKHTETKGGPYICTAVGCYRVFARPDARLKHARKQHPGLCPEPVWRRQGHGIVPSTSPPCADTALPTSSFGGYETSSIVSQLQGNTATHMQRITAIERRSTTGTQASSTTASSLDFNVGQWLHSTPQSSVCENSIGPEVRQKLQSEVTSTIEVEELPRAARIVFAGLHAKLDADTYSRLCDTTFKRWEGLVQQLRDDRSDCYFVYAKVVEDLNSVIHAIDCGAIDSASLEYTTSSFHTNNPYQNQRNGSGGSGVSNLGLGTGIGSSTGAGIKSNLRRASPSNGSVVDGKVTKRNKSKKAEGRAVNCPEYKRWSMMHRNSTTPPCRGCRETLMSQVRSHLNRVGHRDFTTAKQCSVCKKDFVDQQAYESHVEASNCQHEAQSRNDIVIPWAKLYLAQYPDATRIPIPYCDERGWLPDSVLAECRASIPLPSTPFLGQRGPGPSTSLAPRISISPNSVDAPSYNTALNFLLQDVIAPTQVRAGGTHAAILADRVSRLTSNNAPTESPGSANGAVESFLRAFHGASAQYFRLLADAPHYLTEEQFQQTRVEAEAVVQHMRNYQRRRTRQTQNQVSPSFTTFMDTMMNAQRAESSLINTAQPQYFGQYMESANATPVPNQPSPAASHEQYGSVGMSTQPSSQGFNTSSSQYHMSQHTGPSSLYDPTDFTLQSPFTPNNYHWTVRSPQASLDVPRFHRRWSNSLSPQDGTINPSLLESPKEDYDEEADDVRRRLF